MLMAEQLGPGHFRIVDFSLDPMDMTPSWGYTARLAGRGVSRGSLSGSRRCPCATEPLRHGKRGRGDRLKNFTVLNTVLIFVIEWRAPHKPLKLLARPKRLELLTPGFVVSRPRTQRCVHTCPRGGRASASTGPSLPGR